MEDQKEKLHTKGNYCHIPCPKKDLNTGEFCTGRCGCQPNTNHNGPHVCDKNSNHTW